MHSLLLSLHFIFVPIVVVAGVVTLICGLVVLASNLGWLGAQPRVDWLFHRFLWITAGIGVIQAFWGALLFVSGPHPSDNLHFVYGGIVLLAIPVAWAYSDQKDVRRDIIIMTIAAIAVVGAAFRALVTGMP